MGSIMELWNAYLDEIKKTGRWIRTTIITVPQLQMDLDTGAIVWPG